MTSSTEGVIVKIYGKEYSIVSDVDKKITTDIANIVDEKMREFPVSNTDNVNTLKIAVLSAMNIAGELYEYKEKFKKTEEKLKKIAEKSEKLSLKINKVSNI